MTSYPAPARSAWKSLAGQAAGTSDGVPRGIRRLFIFSQAHRFSRNEREIGGDLENGQTIDSPRGDLVARAVANQVRRSFSQGDTASLRVSPENFHGILIKRKRGPHAL